MKQNNFIKYYRVYKNGTSVTEVSANDFLPRLLSTKSVLTSGKPVDVLCSIPSQQYSLPADGAMYYGYLDKIKAMEMAKAGALTHIEIMIKYVEDGIEKLRQYRYDHYQDLNFTLLEDNIRRLSTALNSK